ncbi:MAG: major facilitator family transporter [Pseudomonadota bacterium]|jgi:MFS family permease
MKAKKMSHKKIKSTGTRVSVMGFLMFGLAALYYFYEYWLRVAPTVMSAELKSFFNISDPMLGHLAACYYYAYVVMQIPVGVIFDRYSVRTVLTLACAICVGGTFLFCGTDSFWMAQLGRFLMGFGSAFAYVGVLKISSIWFPKKYFGISAGICTALGMIGGYSGLTFIGWLVQTDGWQLGLRKIAWFGVGLTALLWFMLRDKPAKLVLVEKDPEEASKTIRHKSGKKLINSFTGILTSPKVWLSGLIGSLTYLPISAFAELWAVPYLEAVGYTKAAAATCSGTLFWGFAVGGPLWGVISAALNRRQLPLILGSLLSSIVSLGIITMPEISHSWMSIFFFACGLFASAQILSFAVASDLCVKRMNGTAVAFTNMLVMLGGALLQPVIGLLLHFMRPSEPTVDVAQLSNVVENYRWALSVLPISLLLSAGLSWFIHEPEPRKSIKKKR